MQGAKHPCVAVEFRHFSDGLLDDLERGGCGLQYSCTLLHGDVFLDGGSPVPDRVDLTLLVGPRMENSIAFFKGTSDVRICLRESTSTVVGDDLENLVPPVVGISAA